MFKFSEEQFSGQEAIVYPPAPFLTDESASQPEESKSGSRTNTANDSGNKYYILQEGMPYEIDASNPQLITCCIPDGKDNNFKIFFLNSESQIRAAFKNTKKKYQRPGETAKIGSIFNLIQYPNELSYGFQIQEISAPVPKIDSLSMLDVLKHQVCLILMHLKDKPEQADCKLDYIEAKNVMDETSEPVRDFIVQEDRTIEEYKQYVDTLKYGVHLASEINADKDPKSYNIYLEIQDEKIMYKTNKTLNKSNEQIYVELTGDVSQESTLYQAIVQKDLSGLDDTCKDEIRRQALVNHHINEKLSPAIPRLMIGVFEHLKLGNGIFSINQDNFRLRSNSGVSFRDAFRDACAASHGEAQPRASSPR